MQKQTFFDGTGCFKRYQLAVFHDVLCHTARIDHYGGHGQVFDFSKDEFYSLRRQALITNQ